ncbi:holo-ACP synthase [Helicobacter baculiformis]|uniref:Holo-[acyl-carrier-protein] synthase n=1 Tax=Helicobacter baculiformis TaxID=427351 RepID=A0ABV7ZI77_9HELI|nr:holo-ACP synthase [Helicobacter baculiformis]
MIGIDLISIARIAKALARYQQHFLDRYLSSYEQSLFLKPASLAGAWAAKEACSKALGVGIGAQLGFLDICLSKDSKGAPQITLVPAKMRVFCVQSLHVSISHDSGFAMAVVFANLKTPNY